MQTFVFSSEIDQGCIANSKVRSVALIIGDPDFEQALPVHSALDIKGGAWDGSQQVDALAEKCGLPAQTDLPESQAKSRKNENFRCSS